MYILLSLILNIHLGITAPARLQKRNTCDLRVSPLGNTYFRKTTPWGQDVDIPCPPGYLFQLSSCLCEKRKCAVLDSDPSVYKEFIDDIGEWVTGQCPQGMIYREDYCMCTLQKDYVTRGPTTPLPTVLPENCPYRQIGPSSYEEFFPSINDWVTNYCPHGTVYNSIYCKCVGQVTQNVSQKPDSTVETTTKRVILPPTSCSYLKVGSTSYKEYRNDLGDWLTSNCPAGQIYSATWCSCLIEGQTPDMSNFPTTPPLVQNCNYLEVGPSSYSEYIPEVGAWVTNNCAAGKVYSHPHCACVDANLIQLVSKTTTETTTTFHLNPDCDLRQVGQSSYQKYEESLQDLVTINCHAGMIFNSVVCHCVQEGVVVTDIPVTTAANKDHTLATNPNCPYIPVSNRSYKEYVPALAAWVTNDCPSEMMFNVAMCSCHPDGSADIIVVPITTTIPLNKPTVPNCPHQRSGKGYLEYIAEVDIWVYNDCPIDHEFVKQYCTCLSKSDIGKIPVTTTNTATPIPSSTTTTTTTPTPSTSSSTTASTTTPTPSKTTETHITSIPSTTISETQTSSVTHPTTTLALPPQPTTSQTTLPPPTKKTTTMPSTSVTMTTLSTKQPSTTRTTITETPVTSQVQTSLRSTNYHDDDGTTTTTAPCKKSPSALGKKYYTTVVDVWGELTFMCPTNKIYHHPMCDCIYPQDIPSSSVLPITTTETTINEGQQTSTPLATTSKTTTPQPSIPTTTVQPSTTTALPQTSSTKSTTSALTVSSSTTTTTEVPTAQINAVCPLEPSDKGIEYFIIYLGIWGAVEMICPYHQIFVQKSCRCLPH